MPEPSLPSWRPGTTRDAILDFLAAVEELPASERVAVFDNDGTLWCEKPRYPQLDFFVQQLRDAVAERPQIAERAEYRALLDGDRAALAEIGMPRVALALVELCEGMTPEEFDARSRGFFATARHPDRDVPLARMRYQPMLELLDALRALDFSVFIVTGGGTEFVRALGEQLYGVPPEAIVGSQVGYRLTRVEGRPELLRTADVVGEINEGEAKITNIRRQIGRHPILAGGNSPGDREMLEYATAFDGPSLALLVDHDDAEREYAYRSEAGTYETDGNITDVGHRLGWTVVSMRDDWSSVFVEP